MDDAHALPDDLIECQQLLWAAFQQNVQIERRADASEQRAAAAEQHVAASEQRVAELDRVLDDTAESYEELKRIHQAALEELSALKRWIYGRRRERIVDGEGQQHLFELNPVADAEGTNPPEPEPPVQEVAAHRRRRRRGLNLDDLPHFRHELQLAEAEKTCGGCGRAKGRIGEDVSKILEFVPATLGVHEYVRPKYACRYCKDGVSSPPPPPRPIPRGIAGPGLVAQVVVSKFGDHLPLYRLEDIFTRHGVHIARSTLCDWVRAAADLLQPLYELQRERVLESPIIWTDDTGVTVLVGGEEGSRRGHFWAYIGGAQHPYSVYDFTTNRSRDGPVEFLKGYQGYLQADAYGGYDGIYTKSGGAIVEVACWAHARRKFFDASGSSPRQAHQVIEWVRQLYDVEDRSREWSPAARRSLRAAESEPVLDKIEAYLAELATAALPKSALGKAVTYARNQWQALRRYTTDGRLSIDNNTAERTLRHQAIGRKNWLFLGSQAAGPRAAVLCTILAGARRHRIEPWAYLREILLQLNGDNPRLAEMLPDRWAAANPESVLTHRLEESRQKAATKRDRRRRRRALTQTRPR